MEETKQNMQTPERTCYSDEELAEFKKIILEMLEKAKAEYNTLRQVVMHNGTNDIEDTTPSFKTVEDDGAMQLSREELASLHSVNTSSSRTLRPRWCVSRTRHTVSAVLPESSSLRSVSVSFLMQPLP